MTETTGTPPGPAQSASESSTRDVAKEEARGVAQDAAQSGKQTAETAKQQADQVAGEAASQAKQLLQQARDELGAQGADQKQRAASGLRSLADELGGMAGYSGDSSSSSGVAGDLAREASQRARSAADWLESRQPGDILDEVRRFARQRPGVFLLSAAAAGFLGGRLTRGLAAQAKGEGSEQSPAQQQVPAEVSGTATGDPLAGVGSPAKTGTPVSGPDTTVTMPAGDLPESPSGTPGYSVPPVPGAGTSGTGA